MQQGNKIKQDKRKILCYLDLLVSIKFLFSFLSFIYFNNQSNFDEQFGVTYIHMYTNML